MVLMSTKRRQDPVTVLRPIDLGKEELIPLWDKGARRKGEKRLKGGGFIYDAADLLAQKVGESIARATIYRYAKTGYPVQRGGPFIKLPTVYVGGQMKTSVEAMERFVKAMAEAAE